MSKAKKAGARVVVDAPHGKDGRAKLYFTVQDFLRVSILEMTQTDDGNGISVSVYVKREELVGLLRQIEESARSAAIWNEAADV